jgi:Nucleoside 2-deoxyribosyltransferase like
MAQVLKPPTPLDFDGSKPSIFLAGSIEMGQAEAWQARFEEALRGADITILNPRRDEWDATWAQRIDNPQFRAQVEWELAAQERATLIAIYFAPATKAPVTLLELGLFARSGKVVVCCPNGYWRKGNVEVVCARYGVPMVESLDALIAYALKAAAP